MKKMAKKGERKSDPPRNSDQQRNSDPPKKQQTEEVTRQRKSGARMLTKGESVITERGIDIRNQSEATSSGKRKASEKQGNQPFDDGQGELGRSQKGAGKPLKMRKQSVFLSK